MPTTIRWKLLLACSMCFALGWFWDHREPANLFADPVQLRAKALPFPMTARLGANIYLQTSAEYRACCLQIYQCAELRLETSLKAARPKHLKPAVVMDLDETVFDNSAFQTFLYKNNLEYTEALWAVYEEKYPQEVTLVPGALKFIARAEALGVTVIFLSNRSEVHRKSTETALAKNGISLNHSANRLYLKPKNGSSDKSARREAVAARYNVLLYFGDNLRDFSEAFAAPRLPRDATPEECLRAIKQRAKLAEEAGCHWGIDWFVLPNPVYGEWEKLIGADPMKIMHPTRMELANTQ